VVVTYRPGGGSPPHHHAGSAFIYACVLSGTIESQVEGEPLKVYKAGASFYELPGAHHLYSRNPSKTEPASLLAVFVAERAFHPCNMTEETIPMKLTWYGHSAFRIEAGAAKILIDPFLSDNPCWDKGWIGGRAGEDSTQGGGR
jgi:hypothetical protein